MPQSPDKILDHAPLFREPEYVEMFKRKREGEGMPTPAENSGMGDLILFAKAGYAFRPGHSGALAVDESKNYLGTHGYPASDPELDVVFIASGYGIRKGVKIPRMANLDIAPTLAELLGITLADVEGRVLREILE